MRPSSAFRSAALVLASVGSLAADPGDLIRYVPFGTVAPQDVVRDSDGTYWVTALLDSTIRHYSDDLSTEIEIFASPFGPNTFLTGIAHNTIDDTLLVAVASGGSIIELSKDGTPTGRQVPLTLEPVVNRNGFPTVRGLAFYANGDEGRGSIFIVESLGTLIYEIDLDGNVIRTFTHPEDPDGFPGEGASASTGDLELILDDRELVGFYITGRIGDERRILKLDAEGDYTGVAVSLNDAGGNVSGISRHDTLDPESGELVDAFVVVVESNARLAVLEGGEPSFREIFDLSCVAEGREVTLSWSRRQDYDFVEIRRGCTILAQLPGDAGSWVAELPTDGVFELSVRVVDGDLSMETAPCQIVAGPGQILSSVEIDADRAVDMAWDDNEFLFVSDAFEHRLLAFDASYSFLGFVLLTEDIAVEDEAITGIARGDRPETLFVFNNSRASILRVNYAGELLESIEPALPNLADPAAEGEEEPEPDFGTVFSMTFDPTGDEGAGSLWLLEITTDTVHEVALDGSLLKSFPHPYHDRVLGPPGSRLNVYSSGLARVPGSQPTRLLLTGGSATDFGQRFFLEIDSVGGEIIRGSEFPTNDLSEQSGVSTFSVEFVPGADGTKLLAMPFRRDTSIFEVNHLLSTVSPPTALVCRQRSEANEVELRIDGGGPFDSIEIFRDCELLTTIPGDSRFWVDENAPVGLREYSVRGVQTGDRSATLDCEVTVGAGAILQQAFASPSRSPQQITVDPVDGSFWVSVDWPGDERTLYHFGADLDFIEERESVLEPPWKISSLAIRETDEGERQLFILAWQQPITPSDAGRETFFLVRQTLKQAGDDVLIDEVEIDPPRPTNGFVTYPTALAWDSGSDTFWYLERNTKQLVHMRPDGSVMSVLPHPAPPFQNFVFNLGLTVVPHRDAIWISTSERRDHQVTKAIEVGFDGVPTGAEIRFDTVPGVVRGFTYERESLFLTAPGSLSRLIRVKLFPEVPEPFTRGDANGDGAVNLTDAINTLEFLFRGRTGGVLCKDGADADDDGKMSINDPVVVLRRLFLGGDPLPLPYPEPGYDPTPDGFDCLPTSR